MRIVTRSGNVYNIMNGRWWSERQGGMSEALAFLKVVDRDELKRLVAGPEGMKAVWDYIKALPDATEPVIGKGLYFSSTEAWRMTTDIVSFEGAIDDTDYPRSNSNA